MRLSWRTCFYCLYYFQIYPLIGKTKLSLNGNAISKSSSQSLDFYLWIFFLSSSLLSNSPCNRRAAGFGNATAMFFCGAFCIGSVSREKMKTYKTDWRSYYRANEEKSSARGNEEVILSVWDCTPVVKGSRKKELWCGKIKYLSDRA